MSLKRPACSKSMAKAKPSVKVEPENGEASGKRVPDKADGDDKSEDERDPRAVIDNAKKRKFEQEWDRIPQATRDEYTACLGKAGQQKRRTQIINQAVSRQGGKLAIRAKPSEWLQETITYRNVASKKEGWQRRHLGGGRDALCWRREPQEGGVSGQGNGEG